MSLPPPTWFSQDGPCPHCKALAAAKDVKDGERRARACDDCHEPIPVYAGMGGSGYESATVSHFHLEPAGSGTMRAPIMRELCADCYRKDYQVQFPGAPDPV